MRAAFGNGGRFLCSEGASSQGYAATQPYQPKLICGNSCQALPRFVFTASTSHSALATISATGRIKTAFCKFPPKESASRPTISGDHMSPKRWMVKMETAMALARRFTGAVSRMSVLTGPVGKNRKNIAAARNVMDQNVEVAVNAPNASGTAK